MSRRFLVAGGGTGGHVTPALALAEEIRARGDEVLLVGSDRGLETRLVPESGFELAALPSRQLMGRSLAARAGAVLALVRASLAAWAVLRRFRPHVAISVGGYASVPAVVAAVLRRVPLALVEPNAIPGRANRWAARAARAVFVAFDEAARALGRGASDPRVEVVGVPLRRRLIESVGRAAPHPPSPRLRLLVFGGSQGARQINQALLAALSRLDPKRLEIFHQTGAEAQAEVTEAYARNGFSATVVAFEPDMPSRYAWADVALCRSGALTVAELALAGVPALLVPFPHAADDHQRANARALEAAGAARVLDPGTLSGDRLAEAIEALLREPERLAAMRGRAAALARPDAARRIVDRCAALADRRAA
jgi:UDP-N-acetylglucosamine--N-acetylmuramyl-(pentapeptide) pyrophosphoryl-undecaprenol N-acetylglucosamine transferase